jgi:hypothetical protein
MDAIVYGRYNLVLNYTNRITNGQVLKMSATTNVRLLLHSKFQVKWIRLRKRTGCRRQQRMPALPIRLQGICYQAFHIDCQMPLIKYGI